MEYSIDGWFAANIWEDVVISTKGKELLEGHLVTVCITVPWIDITQCTEQLTHEINHNFRIYQIHQFAHLRVLYRSSVILFHRQRKNELLYSE